MFLNNNIRNDDNNDIHNEEKKYSFFSNDDNFGIKKIKQIANLPKIQNFNENEFEELYNKFKNDSHLEFFIEIFDKKIKKQEIVNIKHGDLSENAISIFIKYLILFQNQRKFVYNVKYNTLSCICVLKIKNYDFFTNKAKFILVENFQNLQKITNYKYLIFMLMCDKRWFLLVYSIFEKIVYIYDFLYSELSNINNRDIEFLVKKLYNKFFGLEIKKINFNNTKKNDFYSTKSLEILFHLSNLVLDYGTYPEYIEYNEKKLDLFRKKLIWLFLKLKNFHQKDIFFFDLESNDQNINNESNNNDLFDEIYKKQTDINSKNKNRNTTKSENPYRGTIKSLKSVFQNNNNEKNISFTSEIDLIPPPRLSNSPGFYDPRDSVENERNKNVKFKFSSPEIKNLDRMNSLKSNSVLLKKASIPLPNIEKNSVEKIINENNWKDKIEKSLVERSETQKFELPKINLHSHNAKGFSVFNSLFEKIKEDNNEIEEDSFLKDRKKRKRGSFFELINKNPQILVNLKELFKGNDLLKDLLKKAYREDLKEKFLEVLYDELEDYIEDYERNQTAFSIYPSWSSLN